MQSNIRRKKYYLYNNNTNEEKFLENKIKSRSSYNLFNVKECQDYIINLQSKLLKNLVEKFYNKLIRYCNKKLKSDYSLFLNKIKKINNNYRQKTYKKKSIINKNTFINRTKKKNNTKKDLSPINPFKLVKVAKLKFDEKSLISNSNKKTETNYEEKESNTKTNSILSYKTNNIMSELLERKWTFEIKNSIYTKKKSLKIKNRFHDIYISPNKKSIFNFNYENTPDNNYNNIFTEYNTTEKSISNFNLKEDVNNKQSMFNFDNLSIDNKHSFNYVNKSTSKSAPKKDNKKKDIIVKLEKNKEEIQFKNKKKNFLIFINKLKNITFCCHINNFLLLYNNINRKTFFDNLKNYEKIEIKVDDNEKSNNNLEENKENKIYENNIVNYNNELDNDKKINDINNKDKNEKNINKNLINDNNNINDINKETEDNKTTKDDDINEIQNIILNNKINEQNEEEILNSIKQTNIDNDIIIDENTFKNNKNNQINQKNNQNLIDNSNINLNTKNTKKELVNNYNININEPNSNSISKDINDKSLIIIENNSNEINLEEEKGEEKEQEKNCHRNILIKKIIDNITSKVYYNKFKKYFINWKSIKKEESKVINNDEINKEIIIKEEIEIEKQNDITINDCEEKVNNDNKIKTLFEEDINIDEQKVILDEMLHSFRLSLILFHIKNGQNIHDSCEININDIVDM